MTQTRKEAATRDSITTAIGTICLSIQNLSSPGEHNEIEKRIAWKRISQMSDAQIHKKY